jgi:hypothetical protein
MSIDPDKIIEQYKQMSANGGVGTLEPLLSLFRMGGKPISLVGREPMLPLYKTRRPKRTTVQAGRQVSKTSAVGQISSLMAGLDELHIAIVEPLFNQKKMINNQILSPLIRDCAISDKIIRPADIDTLDVKKFLSGGQITLINGYKAATGARGCSGASAVFIDEVQDILNINIPVFEAVTDAKTETGFRFYTGTAKTLDGPLAIKFEQSAQGHWCVKCDCGKYVIFAPEEQLFSTITPKGCLCPFCNRKIHSETGGFIFKFPSRCATHVGYHLPQTIFPFHHTELAWKEIIYKQNNIPKTQFYNEVLGISDSDSVRLLTKADLLNARNNIKSKDHAKSLIHQYDLRVLGVDWGGGGGKESATGICVLGKNYAVNHFETLYIHRLPTGLTPEQEAAFVDRIAGEFKVDLIAHDYTGAGFMREAFFLNVYPYWKDRIFPVSYSYKPTSDLVSVSGTGSRTSYVVDKTKSLLLTIGCIKHAVLTVPWFDPLDASAPQLDFLAIIEHEQKTADESATGNEVLRGSTVYLLDKVSGVRDDAAQAVNIAFIAMCHTLGVYPVIHYDSKFDMSDEQYKALAGE